MEYYFAITMRKSYHFNNMDKSRKNYAQWDKSEKSKYYFMISCVESKKKETKKPNSDKNILDMWLLKAEGGWKRNWRIFQLRCVCVLVAQMCPTLCDSVECSLPSFYVHGILQVRILEWVPIPFFRGSSQARDWTYISSIAGKFFMSYQGILSYNINKC